jgi:DNA-directed RNA polymerase subunit beta'
MAYHDARRVKEQLDEQERRAIADAEAVVFDTPEATDDEQESNAAE